MRDTPLPAQPTHSDEVIKSSRHVLAPVERASEILFGLIMVLTLTNSLDVAQAGREGVRTMPSARSAAIWPGASLTRFCISWVTWRIRRGDSSLFAPCAKLPIQKQRSALSLTSYRLWSHVSWSQRNSKRCTSG